MNTSAQADEKRKKNTSQLLEAIFMVHFGCLMISRSDSSRAEGLAREGGDACKTRECLMGVNLGHLASDGLTLACLACISARLCFRCG